MPSEVNVLLLLILVCTFGIVLVFLYFVFGTAIRYVGQPHRLLVFMEGPTEFKILGPGWVFLNPFSAKTIMVSLQEQTLKTKVSVEADQTVVFEISGKYQIIDVEKSVKHAMVYGREYLSRQNAKRGQQGNKTPPDAILQSPMALMYAFVIFIASGCLQQIVKEKNADKVKVVSTKEEIELLWKQAVQKDLLAGGIQLMDAKILVAY